MTMVVSLALWECQEGKVHESRHLFLLLLQIVEMQLLLLSETSRTAHGKMRSGDERRVFVSSGASVACIVLLPLHCPPWNSNTPFWKQGELLLRQILICEAQTRDSELEELQSF